MCHTLKADISTTRTRETQIVRNLEPPHPPLPGKTRSDPFASTRNITPQILELVTYIRGSS